MASFNRVIVIGNLTKDPELKRNPSGTAVCTLRLAINESYRNKEGEKIDRPVFVEVVAWNQHAEFCNQYFSKGNPILIEGRLQYEEWKTHENETRSKLRILATHVAFVGPHGSSMNAQKLDESPDKVAESAPPTTSSDESSLGF